MSMDDPVRPATDAERLYRLYELHAADETLRAVLAAYAAGHRAIERCALELRELGEHRMAASITSRAHDFFLQALRNTDDYVRRNKGIPNSTE
jgi:hypothetical protein